MPDSRSQRRSRYRPASVAVGLVALAMALVAGLVGTVVLGRLWRSGWLFLLLVCVLFVFVSRYDTSRAVIVRGLYVTAGFVVLYPAVVLLDLMIAPADPDGGGLWVAAVLYTLVVRVPIALVLAGGMVVLAHLIDRRARDGRIDRQATDEVVRE